MGQGPGSEDDVDQPLASALGLPDPDPRALELERRLRSCPTLPSLPSAVLGLVRLCRAEDVDLQEIAEAVGQDPALAARVLRSANSVAYAARGQVSTLPRAVALLGSNSVMALALSSALLQGRRSDVQEGLDHAAFWRRALLSASAARALAEILSTQVDPEEAFVAGLLQDLGMLALFELFRERYGYLCTHTGHDHDALVVMERDVWGTDHAIASAVLAQGWGLPAALVGAVAGSHDAASAEPPAPGADPQVRLLRCVTLSGPIADAWTAAPGLDTALALEAARVGTGLSPTTLQLVIARMALTLPDLGRDAHLDLGGPDRIAELLEEARRLLVHRGGMPGGGGARLSAPLPGR